MSREGQGSLGKGENYRRRFFFDFRSWERSGVEKNVSSFTRHRQRQQAKGTGAKTFSHSPKGGGLGHCLATKHRSWLDPPVLPPGGLSLMWGRCLVEIRLATCAWVCVCGGGNQSNQPTHTTHTTNQPFVLESDTLMCHFPDLFTTQGPQTCEPSRMMS